MANIAFCSRSGSSELRDLALVAIKKARIAEKSPARGLVFSLYKARMLSYFSRGEVLNPESEASQFAFEYILQTLGKLYFP
jgi:hypothetical protein